MKKTLLAIFTLLGLTEKGKTGTLSAEELDKINVECQKQLKMTFTEALEKSSKENKDLEATHQEALKALFESENSNADASQKEVKSGEATPGTESHEEVVATGDLVKGIKDLKKTVQEQALKIAILEKDPEKGDGKKVDLKKFTPINSAISTEKHLFGIEHPFFGLEKPWNRIAATRKDLAALASIGIMGNSNWENYKSDFKVEFRKYAQSFSERFKQLQAEHKLENLKFNASSLDFTGFDGTGWGELYLVRRQDALIAYFRSLPSIRNIFPVIYGIQDKMEMTNSFLDDLGQSYQSGKVFKGANYFQPMLAEVFDAMFKFKFTDLKNLEKEYIGYLNREGSDPIKWTMIEWIMARNLEKLNSEWNYRRINGFRVEPTIGTAGHYLHASNGLKRQLQKYVEDFRLARFTEITTYTSSTILTAVEAFAKKLNEILPSLQGYALYLNEKHVPWYLAAFRTAYGAQFDFSGAKMAVMNYPDLQLIPVPNMGNSCLIFATMPGNIELYENVAGEMANFYFQQDMEELMVASWWKEGVGGYKVGKKFDSAVLLAADNFQNQYIFLNDPTVTLAANATTCDATKGEEFITVANGGATAITDITGAEEGKVYTIVIGHITNASNIAKSAKFSELDSAWTPTAVGDFLKVFYTKSTGKFTEVSRLVTGS